MQLSQWCGLKRKVSLIVRVLGRPWQEMQAGPASLERATVDNFGFAILETPYVENAGRASSCAGSSFGNFTFHCAFAFLLSAQNGLDTGRHHCWACWAMDALQSERIKLLTSSWLDCACSEGKTEKTMDVIMPGLESA